MAKRKIPLRKCVACGENRSKKELIRIVKNRENEVLVDLTGKLNGRGAYICSNNLCLEKAKANHRLDKALKTDISGEIYEKLSEIINKNN